MKLFMDQSEMSALLVGVNAPCVQYHKYENVTCKDGRRFEDRVQISFLSVSAVKMSMSERRTSHTY